MFAKPGFVASYPNNAIASSRSKDVTYLEFDTLFTPSTGEWGAVDLTNDGQNITINTNYNYIIMLAKPRGKNCALQGWVISFSKPSTAKSIELTDVVSGVVSKESRVVEGNSQYSGLLKNIRDTLQAIPAEGFDASKVVINPTETLVSVLKVKAGTAASANINWNGLTPLKTSGLVTITDNGVTVSANATSADSVRSQYLDVIIED